jgi:hypothetical protein
MTTLKLIRHEADQTISVYGPALKGRLRRHLGLIFLPVRAEGVHLGHTDFQCSPTMFEDKRNFATEAEAIRYFEAMA